MTLTTTLHNYYRLSRLTRTHMQARKTEFITEIMLSAFIVYITLQRQGNPAFAVGAIAVIHSFNFARALEAYHEAQADFESHD